MDEGEYDVVICGTGLTECILSGLLSQEKYRVLHIDKNSFYGGEGASLNLTSMWKMFRQNSEPPKELGFNRDWNIDLIPKFVMSDGNLVKILLKTRVSKYLEWKSIDGTYVYQMKKPGFFSKGGGTIAKVPSNDSEALKSDLMGLLEKRRCKNFFVFIQNCEENDPNTWKNLDIFKQDFRTLVNKYELEDNTIDFIGHAVALYTNDDYLNRPIVETLRKIKLYMNSMGRYGDSPFIYPIYGLGGIPEGFSRMCAIFGGTFMLNTNITQIRFGEDGKVSGISNNETEGKTKMVICSPDYAVSIGLQDRVKSLGKVIRCICIMDHPIKNTKNIPSVQIIIPQRQTGRQSDIFVMMVSGVHQVCKKGYYVAIVSAMMETNNPEKELEPAFELIDPVLEKFITISDLFVPVNDNVQDNVYITESLDPTSHFEQCSKNVLKLYKQITGKELDLTNLPEDNDE